MVLIAVRLQISHLSDLVSVGRASAVALSHSFDISLSLSLSEQESWGDVELRELL